MPLLDHFGLLAPHYEKLIPLRHAEALIAHIGLPIAGRLLDAGGGTGRVAKALTQYAGQVVVADPSTKMLGQAVNGAGLQAVCSFSEKLPFAAESFERIIMVDALHHVCNQAETAREFWRVLKPGGRLVIEEPDIRTFAVKLVAIAEKLAFMRSHFLTPAQIAELFPYPNARVRVEKDGFNAWVVVEKD